LLVVLFVALLLKLAFWSGLFQFAGASLVIWGVDITGDTGAEGGYAIPFTCIRRRHPWAVHVGANLLLLGLALQIVCAVLS
jgi:hypothetical protein